MEEIMFLNIIIKSYSPASPGKKIHYDIEIMSYFHNKGWRFLAKRHQEKIFYKYGCEIIRGAEIDKSVRFQHITGIVIGCNAKVGKMFSFFSMSLLDQILVQTD